MKTRSAAAWSLAIASAALPAFCPSSAASDEALGPQVDRVFAGLQGETPGCAVTASQGDRTLFRRAYGMANLESKSPITVDTVFEAGSASKQVTAATVLLLARQRKISLSDDIRRYLPEMPDYGTVITIANLLHHTSGIRDWGSLAALQGWPRNSRSASNADVLSIVSRQRSLNFAPGTHFLYSNSNYNLLVIIVERVTGETIDRFDNDEIFAPLGMTRTSWRSDHQRIVPGRAAAYGRDARGLFNDPVIEDAFGNGGLLTTIDDLARWQHALEHDGFGPGFTEQMQTTAKLNDGQAVGYGLGLYISHRHGWLEIYHEGITGGYHAWVARYPERRIAITMLCNSSDIPARPLGRQVADLLLPPVPAAVSTPSRPVQAGTYADVLTGIPLRIDPGTDGALRVNGRLAERIAPDRWTIPDNIFDFSNGTLVRETVQGERFAYRRVTVAGGPSTADLAGRYCSAEADACLVVGAGAEGLTLAGPRGTARPLTHAYGDVFTSSLYPSDQELTLAFERSRTGTVTGLRTSDDSAYGIAFTRTR